MEHRESFANKNGGPSLTQAAVYIVGLRVRTGCGTLKPKKSSLPVKLVSKGGRFRDILVVNRLFSSKLLELHQMAECHWPSASIL